MARLAGRYIETLQGGGTLFFAGNGGSAADAQHLATEYVVRYSHNRRALPAIALTTDTSLLTACGNDLGFDEIFARQIEALARPGDLVVLHSTSGESPNVVRAAQAARAKGVHVVALLGKGGGAARELVDDCVVIPADETSHIQELHLAVERGLGDPAAAERAVAEAARALGGLDLLIVNHGVWPPDDMPVARMIDAQWDATRRANLDAVFYVCRATIPLLPEGGRIVLVSSTAGQRGEAFHADYAATKGAVIAFTKSLAVELAPRITVNCVAPGWVDTEMAQQPYGREGGKGKRDIERTIPLGRVASAEDIAGPIVFLCSALARHITGEVLNVNGGSVLCG